MTHDLTLNISDDLKKFVLKVVAFASFVLLVYTIIYNALFGHLPPFLASMLIPQPNFVPRRSARPACTLGASTLAEPPGMPR